MPMGDGAHISTLLLTFLYLKMCDLIVGKDNVDLAYLRCKAGEKQKGIRYVIQ